MLPVEITPNPLLSSSVEIRFQDEFAPAFVDSVLPIKLQEKFDMQKEQKDGQTSDDPNSIVFKNDTFLVAIVDKKSIIFENVNHYQLWKNYFPFIKDVVTSISIDAIQSPIERVGVRYISFFAKVDNIATMLKKPFMMVEDEIGEVSNANFYGNYTFQRGDYNCTVQVASRIQFPRETKIREGCVIDLDLSTGADLPDFRNERLFTIIDSLHNEEKRLFVSLLNKDFMNSLNIKY